MDTLSPQDRDLVARTILSEAGNDGDAGMAAVASVIKNRVDSGQFGSSPSRVVLAPGQFEPWSLPRQHPNNPSRVATSSPDYQHAASIADSVWAGTVPDQTGGATHFYSPIDQAALGRKAPSWASGTPLAQIGHHAFYAPNGQVQQAPNLDQTAASLGLTRGAAPPVASASPVAAPSPDLDDTAASLGLTRAGKMPPPAVAPGTVTQATPTVQSQAAALLQHPGATGTGFGGSVVEGMPIIGPAFEAMRAAGETAVDPTSTFYHNMLVNQEAQRQYAAANPLTAGFGNVTGAGIVTAPFGMTGIGGRTLGLTGSTLGARFYGGTIGGGVLGGLDAAARGQDPISGAETGAAFGGGGVLAGEALGAGVRAGSSALYRPPGPLSGVNPIGRGWLATALANETPQSLAAARARMGPFGFAADINPSMTDLAAGVAVRAEPPASQTVSEAYRLRQAGAPQRINDAVNRAMGPPVDMVQRQQDIIAARSAAADPLYNQWRTMQVFPTPQLKALIPRLEAAGAFDQAEKLSGITGEPINRNFFTTGPQKAYPTTQTWDYVKRGLDSKIDQAYASGDNTTARALVNLRQQLVTEIGNTPAGQVWQQARQAFAEPSGLIDQIAAGRDTFLGGRSGTSVDELRHELQGLSQPELMARIQGMRSAVSDTMGDTVNGGTTLRNKLLAPNNQDKLRLMLGQGRAQDLIDSLNQETYLAGQAQYVRPQAGSATGGRTRAGNALDAPPLPHWNPNLAEPLSFIPPSWIDALRPSTVLQGSRDATYAGARQQLPSVLLGRGPTLDDLLADIRAEGANRAQAANRGQVARSVLTGALTGPASELYRLRAAPYQGALASPAQ